MKRLLRIQRILSPIVVLVLSQAYAVCHAEDVTELHKSNVVPSTTQSESNRTRSWSRWSVRASLVAGETAGGGDLQSGPTYELDLDYHFAKQLFLRAGYQTASLDLYREFNRSVYVASAHAQIPKFGAFWTHSPGGGSSSFSVGFIAGHESFTAIRPSPQGLQSTGLEQITAKSGLLFGGEVDVEKNIGHTPLFVGGTLSLMFAKGARIEMRSPSVGYVDSTRWSPLLFGLTGGYRFH